MTKRLLIIDSNLYASRLYHDLIRTDNIADIDTLTKVIKDRLSLMLSRHQPTHVVSVYDVGKSTYRTAIYPNYKKNRKHNQERELFIRYFRTVIESSGVCCISSEGVEADDIVATIVNRRMDIFGENIATVIDSSDKDFRQLVSGSCSLFIREKKWLYTQNAFMSYYHFAPNRFPLFLALFGDVGDSITPVLNKAPLESKYEHLKGIFEMVARCHDQDSLLDWSWEHYADHAMAKKVINNADKLDRNIKLVTLLNNIDISELTADRMDICHIQR